MKMYCSRCGAQIGEDAKFCPSCGAGNQNAQQVSQPVQQQPVVVNVVNTNTNTNTNTNGFETMYGPLKSRWAAFFLCLFLGYFGAHKFYVGKTGTGILWLLTFGIFGAGWLMDCLLILLGRFEDKYGIRLR